MLVVKNGVVSRVSVKSTSVKTATNKWSVELRNISRRNDGDINIRQFDNNTVDLLVVYIIPEDRITVIDAKTILAKNAVLVT
jgi:tRNA A58 N-methylase Trm61